MKLREFVIEYNLKEKRDENRRKTIYLYTLKV